MGVAMLPRLAAMVSSATVVMSAAGDAASSAVVSGTKVMSATSLVTSMAEKIAAETITPSISGANISSTFSAKIFFTPTIYSRRLKIITASDKAPSKQTVKTTARPPSAVEKHMVQITDTALFTKCIMIDGQILSQSRSTVINTTPAKRAYGIEKKL